MAINWRKAAVSEAAEKQPQTDLLAFSDRYLCAPFVFPSRLFPNLSTFFRLFSFRKLRKVPVENNALKTRRKRCE